METGWGLTVEAHRTRNDLMMVDALEVLETKGRRADMLDNTTTRLLQIPSQMSEPTRFAISVRPSSGMHNCLTPRRNIYGVKVSLQTLGLGNRLRRRQRPLAKAAWFQPQRR